MTLTNYWWLLIWMFLGGGILAYAIPKRKEVIQGRVETRWTPFAAVGLIIPYIIWAAFRTNAVAGDTAAYRASFLSAPSSFNELLSYTNSISKDKGFYFISAFIKCIIGSNDVLYFFIIASIQLLIITWLYRKISVNYWFSIFLFVASTDYMSWAQNGLRQFMAVTIILLATPFMIKKKIIPAILIILLASTMHQSALLMIVFMLVAQGKAWNKRTVLFLIAVLAAIAFVGQFTDILDSAMQETQYANMVTDWTEWEDDGTNPIRVLVYALPTLLSLVGLKYIRNANNEVIDFCTNMSIISTGLYLVSMVTSGIFIGRLPIYASLYGYILLPWEIYNIFEKKSVQIVLLGAVGGYCAFFYYQMHFGWGMI